MTTNFDIFIGGPMGDKSFDGSRVRFSDHISNLESAVEECKRIIASDFPEFSIQIHNPEIDEFGSIPDTVFNMISFAELGLLDLSAESPSVMYELTLMHALGIPVVPIHLKKRVKEKNGKLPFYLQHEYCLIVEDFKVETLAKALLPKLRAALSLEIFGADRKNNPLTRYFGIPLIDASASTGLATGYYHNFIQHVIHQSDSVIDKNDDLKKIVVLRPKTLDDTARIRGRIEKAAKDLDLKIEIIGEKDGKVHASRKHVRGQMILYKVGNYIFDTPAPLLAQKSSPIHSKLARLLLEASGPRKEEINAIFQRRQNEMIEKFFSTLAVLSVGPSSDPTLLDVMTTEEFVEVLKNESSA